MDFVLLSRFKCCNLTGGLIIPKCEWACGVEWLMYEWLYVINGSIANCMCVWETLSAVPCGDQTVHSPTQSSLWGRSWCTAITVFYFPSIALWHIKQHCKALRCLISSPALSLPQLCWLQWKSTAFQGDWVGAALLCHLCVVWTVCIREDFCSFAWLLLAARGKYVLKSICVYVPFLLLSSSRG